VTDVEIYWPAAWPSDHMFAAEAVLRQAGIHATCRLQPTRRGSETVLVLLANAAAGPFLAALFGRLGEEAWTSLRAFVDRLLKHTHERPAPCGVVFESANAAQFVFTTDLPVDAFRKAIEIDPGSEPGRWTWDSDTGNWLRFENRHISKPARS
jgi:hypothetical protein